MKNLVSLEEKVMELKENHVEKLISLDKRNTLHVENEIKEFFEVEKFKKVELSLISYNEIRISFYDSDKTFTYGEIKLTFKSTYTEVIPEIKKVYFNLQSQYSSSDEEFDRHAELNIEFSEIVKRIRMKVISSKIAELIFEHSKLYKYALGLSDLYYRVSNYISNNIEKGVIFGINVERVYKNAIVYDDKKSDRSTFGDMIADQIKTLANDDLKKKGIIAED